MEALREVGFPARRDQFGIEFHEHHMPKFLRSLKKSLNELEDSEESMQKQGDRKSLRIRVIGRWLIDYSGMGQCHLGLSFPPRKPVPGDLQ
jgi:hypothetical protein